MEAAARAARVAVPVSGLEGGRKAIAAALAAEAAVEAAARAARVAVPVSVTSPLAIAPWEPKRKGRRSSEQAGPWGVITGKHKLEKIEGGKRRECCVCKEWGEGRKLATLMCKACDAPVCKKHQCDDELFGTDNDPFLNHALRQVRPELHELVQIGRGKRRNCLVCRERGGWQSRATKMCKACKAPLCMQHQCNDERFGTDNDPFWNHELCKARPEP